MLVGWRPFAEVGQVSARPRMSCGASDRGQALFSVEIGDGPARWRATLTVLDQIVFGRTRMLPAGCRRAICAQHAA
jgi:hypothetical protein